MKKHVRLIIILKSYVDRLKKLLNNQQLNLTLDHHLIKKTK
jgi:hypothetical protein